MADLPECGHSHTNEEAEENCDSAEAWQRAGVHVALLRRDSNPPAGSSGIPHVPGQYKRTQQPQEEQPEANKGQLSHLDTHD